MKYFVTVDGEEHEVELVERLGEVTVSFDGERLEARYEEVDRLGQVALFLGERSYGVSIEGDANEAAVTVAGHRYSVRMEDERERAARAAERGRAGAGGDVLAVMPGVVVELFVEPGAEVAEGDPLLVLEAMKMQNDIRAPHAGRVAAVHVRKGQAVGAGAKLVGLRAPDAGGG